MTMLYIYDSLGNYVGPHEHVPYAAVPANSTDIAPPDGGFPVWVNGEWELRSARAEPVNATPQKPNRKTVVPTSISFAQLLIGLVAEGWLTQAEGEAWLDGVLPAPLTALIDSLPAEARFVALARAKRPSEILRDDPMVVALGAAQGKTAEELDQFFCTYANV